MKCNESVQLFDPIKKKCVKITSKRGLELQRLIKLCRKYEKSDHNCKEINKIYKTSVHRIKKILQIMLVPIISIFVFNMLVILTLSSKKVRSKILSFSLKNHPSTAPYVHIIEPMIKFIPDIVTFVEKYGGLAKAAIFGVDYNTIISVIQSIINLEFSNTNDNIELADKLASKLTELPGSWKDTPPTKIIFDPEIVQRVNNLQDNIVKFIDNNDNNKLTDKEYIKWISNFTPNSFNDFIDYITMIE